MFCYDRIKQECGNLCPGCRTEYGTSKDPFAKLEVKRATETVTARTQPQRESGPAPKPPLHERQAQQAQHRQQRHAGGGSAKGGGAGGVAGHARGGPQQVPQYQNGVPPPPPRQPPPPPPPRAPPPVAQAPVVVSKPDLSRSSSVESSSAGPGSASRHRPPPGWPATPRGDPGGSPSSSVGSGPLPPQIALELAPRADAGARDAPLGGAAERTAVVQANSQGPVSRPRLAGDAQAAAPVPPQEQQQQSRQQPDQWRTLDPQVPPPPTHRKPTAFPQWAPAQFGTSPDASLGNRAAGGLPGFPAAPDFTSPQEVLQAGTVQLGTPLPLSGSGRAVLADPFGRSMLASMRLAVQSGRLTAEDAANQLAGYLRSRDVSSAAVGPLHGFGSPGSNGGYSEGAYNNLGQWDCSQQVQPVGPGPAVMPVASEIPSQWHAAAGAADPHTVSTEALSEPQPAKRAGRRPLYARGSNSGSGNGQEQLQDRDIGVPASNGNVSGAFAGLSLHASAFQPANA